MKLEEMIPSRMTRIIIGIVSAVFILAIVFAAGFYAGAEKAQFSGKWHESYTRAMGGSGMGMRQRVFVDRNYINPHGSSGSVIAINGSTITIKDQEGTEKNILVSEDTTIRKGFTEIKLSDVHASDQIVVIGTPNDQGEVKAQLIRVMPQ